MQTGRPVVFEQRLEGIPTESQPVATVRAVRRARHGRQPGTFELRRALRHVLQALAAGGHAEAVDELLRRVRHHGLAQLLRRHAVADQHQGVHNRAGLRGQRLDQLGSHARRVRQRRGQGTYPTV